MKHGLMKKTAVYALINLRLTVPVNRILITLQRVLKLLPLSSTIFKQNNQPHEN